MIKRSKPLKRTKIKRTSDRDVPKLKRKLVSLLHPAIKDRDGNVCFSCGKTGLEGTNWHAGHMFSAGAHPNLKFHAAAIRSQDFNCNINQGGNGASYAANFIKRFGREKFNLLYEASKLSRKWRAWELEELIEKIKLGLNDYSRFYETRYGPDLSAVCKK